MTEPVPSPFSLAGRRALVTGAGRGIGRAIALAFAAAGATVCLNDLPGDAAVMAAAAACGAGSCVEYADLARDSDRRDLVERVSSRFGGIDILVLNAAIQIPEPWGGIGHAATRQQVETNLIGALDLVQAFTPGMVERGFGRVIAIGSVQQIKEHPRMAVYAATKAALASLMRNLARELGASGVTCNVLAPGVIETERNRAALSDGGYRAAVLERIPARGFGTPEDCAGPALLLASTAGRYITGTTLYIDGGMHL
jgi:NAD(P)-dependent dehydrogenase (short-subunit alcohol dehydrogenase family)